MNKKEQVLKVINEQQLIPLFYHDSLEVSEEVITAMYEGGIRIMEYTNRGVHAIANFGALMHQKATRWPELQLGIGTVKTEQDADNFLALNPDFVVAPCMVPEVGAKVLAAGLLWIPGTMTTTEIAAAQKNGATMLKLFPGSLLGPGYVTAVRDIFPDLMFMPTGGVEPETGNLKAWFKSGVVAVGMGSKLISKDILDNRDYDTLRMRATWLLELVQESRSAK
ncbi:MAG: bifunctional 4-hydroxy-2-oxoglutarate aldolase/2-dehydro-3-deoxy-phosphogluconate aldolase [Bacteroidota bacterium]